MVEELGLDGLIVIGGDDSNTNAAILAEYFESSGCKTKVGDGRRGGGSMDEHGGAVCWVALSARERMGSFTCGRRTDKQFTCSRLGFVGMKC